jgi:VRR-NUC domain-containing protein
MKLSPEEAEHIAVVDWFHYQYPKLYYDFHHFANERKCSIQYGYKLKRMGVKRGIADFFLAIPLNGYAGLWIELKVGKGRLKREQAAFIRRKNQRGYLAYAVWGFEATQKIIRDYLKDYHEI